MYAYTMCCIAVTYTCTEKQRWRCTHTQVALDILEQQQRGVRMSSEQVQYASIIAHGFAGTAAGVGEGSLGVQAATSTVQAARWPLYVII